MSSSEIKNKVRSLGILLWIDVRDDFQSRRSVNNIVLAFLLMTFIGGVVFAQEASKPSLPQPERKIDKAQGSKAPSKGESQDLSLEKRFAQDLLEAIGGRATALDNSILKVKVVARVADALWEHNEPRARQLFVVAFRTIDEIKLDPKQDQRVAMAEKRGGTFGPLFHLRSFVLQLIAHRDFKLADDLRKAFERDAENIELKKTSRLLVKRKKL